MLAKADILIVGLQSFLDPVAGQDGIALGEIKDTL